MFTDDGVQQLSPFEAQISKHRALAYTSQELCSLYLSSGTAAVVYKHVHIIKIVMPTKKLLLAEALPWVNLDRWTNEV